MGRNEWEPCKWDKQPVKIAVGPQGWHERLTAIATKPGQTHKRHGLKRKEVGSTASHITATRILDESSDFIELWTPEWAAHKDELPYTHSAITAVYFPTEWQKCRPVPAGT